MSGNRRWTPAESEKLRRMVEEDKLPACEIGRRLGRSTSSVEGRKKTMGLRLDRGDDADFIADWLAGVDTRLMARKYGYADQSAGSVSTRAKRLGLPSRGRGGYRMTPERRRQLTAERKAVASIARQHGGNARKWSAQDARIIAQGILAGHSYEQIADDVYCAGDEGEACPSGLMVKEFARRAGLI